MLPFFLHFEVQTVFGLVVILFLHLQIFFDGSIEGLVDEVLKFHGGILLLAVYSSKELKAAEASD